MQQNPPESKRILPLLKRKYFQSLTIAFLAAFGTLVQAQTAPNLPGTISSVALSSGFTLNIPGGVAVDQQNNLYISDTDNHRILKVTAAGRHHRVCRYRHPNSRGPAERRRRRGYQCHPQLSPGNCGGRQRRPLYHGIGNNKDVRKVTAATGIISTVASGLNNPLGVAYDDANAALIHCRLQALRQS